MLPCKSHIKCSIYWLLTVDIKSSLLENTRILSSTWQTSQLFTALLLFTITMNYLKVLLSFKNGNHSDFINHMVQKMKHICHFCDGLFFKSHVWDQTLQQEEPLWHRDNSIIWDLWQESKLTLWGVSEFTAENTCRKRKLNESKLNNSDLL